MSDCSVHKRDLFGNSNMKEVADAIGDLHYETLADLFDKIANKLYLDAAKDRAAGRVKLAKSVEFAAHEMNSASIEIEEAYLINKPFMNH